MLSELRKDRVSLTLAHQYLSQLEPEVRDAVFGNVGTFIAFRVGALDAPTFKRERSPTFAPDGLISLPNLHIYLRPMIDGEVSRPFGARTVGDTLIREQLGGLPACGEEERIQPCHRQGHRQLPRNR